VHGTAVGQGHCDTRREAGRADLTGLDPFPGWAEALEARHLRDLTFPEVRRALQALSSLYVERRGGIAGGAALDGAGKRAAFALFYGPIHFLTVRCVVRALEASGPAPGGIVDLGCGTGAAGAAWALQTGTGCEILGVDRSAWALGEARWTWRALGVRGRAVRGDLSRVRLPGRGGAVLATWVLNELPEASRDAALDRLVQAGRNGCRVLVVEPVSRRLSPWWPRARALFESAGGRADEWKFRTGLPASLARLDHAAGLDHRELTARSLWLAGGRT
jgi:SAM-dependent methyltransferase